MKKKLLVGFVLILLLALVFVVRQFIKEPSLDIEGGTMQYFPVSGNENGYVEVKNFLKNQKTVADPSNQGLYFLGNHYPFEGEPYQSPRYVIEYTADTEYFNVVLLTEPVAAARAEAERYLMEQLGISTQQMCNLRYTVSTPYTVNTLFAGQDLKFSFCPGSTSLK